jgi:glycine hydroxymethyltransferase
MSVKQRDLKATGVKASLEVLRREAMRIFTADEFHAGVFDELKRSDAEIWNLISAEYKRCRETLQLIAAENECSSSVLAALGSVVQNKTTEGFVGRRYHGGSEVVDSIETMAVNRAKAAFGASYANVQPHSGTQANQIVMTAILEQGDKILSLPMDQGGHVSHGERVSFSGKFFEVSNYYLDPRTFLLDYDAIRDCALAQKPKLIICGMSAYSRQIDFSRFRAIADEVGAYLLADISHISSLVMAGVHQSPVQYAHFTTTSTYKPGGPRGGLILMGKDFDKKININGREVELCKLIQKTTFPGVQGTPYLNNVAAKAVFFKEAMGDEYQQRQRRIIANAKELSESLKDMGFDILTGGTDNHMVLVNVANTFDGMTGVIAQKSLEECGIIVNMNRLAYDTRSASVASGMRLGTPIVTRNGMDADEMQKIAQLVNIVMAEVKPVNEREYRLNPTFAQDIRLAVKELCGKF